MHKDSIDKNNSTNYKDIPELSLKKNFFGKWTEYFVNNYRVTILLIVIVLIWGVSRSMLMQRESEPKVTIPMAIVTTTYLGASPEEVETLITNPIEKKLDEVENIKSIDSNSAFGYSLITLEFESGTDIKEKVSEVREKVSEVKSSLPDDVDTPSVTDIKTGDNPVVAFTLSGEDDILILQEFAEKIKEKILSVKGVKDVSVVGAVDREILISVDPQKLSTYNLSLMDIKNSLSSSNINLPGGNIELNEKYYNIRTVSQFKDVKEIEDTLILHNQNGQIFIKDVASVIDRFETPDILVRKFNNSNENAFEFKKALAISVTKTQYSDDIQVRDNILKVLDDEKGTLYPEHLNLEIYSDRAKDVENQLGSLVNNAISGLCLVIIVLFIFIGLSESFIVSAVIPLSLLAALSLMQTNKMSLNMVSIFSLLLAVGMLVDNAIVIMENIDRLRSKGLDSALAAKVATNQIAPAVFSSTLTTLAAFFPLSLTSGIMGDYIRPIPLTVIFTLTASFFVAITITPSICTMFLRKNKNESASKQHPQRETFYKYLSLLFVFILSLFSFMDWQKEGFSKITLLSIVAGIFLTSAMYFKLFRKSKTEENQIVKKYVQLLSWLIEKNSRKFAALGITILVFALSLSTIPLGILKVEMFGADDFTSLYVSIQTPPGTNLKNTLKIQETVENRLSGIQGIKGFISFAGHEGVDMYSYGNPNENGTPNMGKIIVELYDLKERDRKSMEIAKEIRQNLKDVTGADIKVSELSMGPSGGSSIYLMVKGEDMGKLETCTKELTAILESVEGSTDVRNGIGILNPELKILVDKSKAASLGLDSMSIALSIRNALNGVEATKYRLNQDEFDVLIKTDESSLKTVHDIEKINFYSYSGTSIPFSQIAKKEEGESKKSILHTDGKRYISISAGTVDGKTASEITNSFNEKIKDYQFQEGITIDYGGEDEMMGDSFGDMMSNMIIALILVFIILTIQFNSLSQPFIILLTVPMSLIGVMSGLIITGYNFGFLSFVGVVALVGIAVNNGIILIDYINYLRNSGYEMNEAIIKTGVTRLVPILATTITTAGGILPITIVDPFFAPLGITLISGLCISSVLTLLIVPAVYSISEGFKSKLKKKEITSVKIPTYEA